MIQLDQLEEIHRKRLHFSRKKNCRHVWYFNPQDAASRHSRLHRLVDIPEGQYYLLISTTSFISYNMIRFICTKEMKKYIDIARERK
jgi:hypothetical protein